MSQSQSYQRLVEALGRDTKGHRRWTRIQGNYGGGTISYFVYVIEVEPLSPLGNYDFYVGSTGKPVKDRFAEHASGGALAARIFRHDDKHPQGRARARRLCYELMLGTPPFPDRATAVRAEANLAARIEACGDRVRSDTLTQPRSAPNSVSSSTARPAL